MKPILTFLFFPFVLIYRSCTLVYFPFKVFIVMFFAVLVMLPVWAVGYSVLIMGGWSSLIYFGFLKVDIPTSGASMLPTIVENSSVAMRRFTNIDILKQKVNRGDLVVFENDKTDEELGKRAEAGKVRSLYGGFIKRVIGIAGDEVLIRDGFVSVNSQPVSEKYILKPRSTFGGEAVPDCQAVKVPEGHIFVLGDNRKRSMDSRQVGLVSLGDIKYYLPFSEQQLFAARWRDASFDQDFANTSELNTQSYLELLNKKRMEAKVGAVKLEPKLARSADKRAKVMLEKNDFSFEATRSGYTMVKALTEVGYSNIVYGEVPTVGYYDAQELIDYFFEFPQSKKFLLEKDYQEIGISTFVGNLNGCPVQVVVQHLAGYVPPNYKAEDIEPWRKLAANLVEIQPGWRKLKEYPEFYQQNKKDIDRINELISLRMNHTEAVIKRMEANQWLTKEEKDYTFQDEQLSKEQDEVATRLNN